MHLTNFEHCENKIDTDKNSEKNVNVFSFNTFLHCTVGTNTYNLVVCIHDDFRYFGEATNDYGEIVVTERFWHGGHVDVRLHGYVCVVRGGVGRLQLVTVGCVVGQPGHEEAGRVNMQSANDNKFIC